MSTRSTRNLNGNAPTNPSNAIASSSTQPPDQTPNKLRKKRLDVDPGNILVSSGTEGGRSLKRRRSPSLVADDKVGGHGNTAGNGTEEEAKKEYARVKGMEVYDAVMYEQDSEGRNLASEFIRLPNKRLFQDYYTLIKHPTSLEIVHDKLRQTFSSLSPPGIGPSSTSDTPGLNKSSTGNNGTKIKIKFNTSSTSTSSTPAPAAPNLEGASYAGTTGEGEDYKGYSNIEEVKKDFDLIWSNAKRYNQKESGIFKDAQKLHRLTKSLFAQEQIEESIVVPSLLAPKVEPTEPGVGSEDEGKKRTRKRVKVDENGKSDSVAKDEKEKQGVSLGEVVRAGMRRLEMATHSDGTEEPRNLAAFFMTLPSKKDYSDYYLFIKQPISLKEIRNKAEKEKYSDLEDWGKDVKLMCDNARFYNEPDSVVYRNAEEIEKIANTIVREGHEKMGTKPKFAQAGGANDNGQPVSTPSGGPKIKLNLRPTPEASTPAPAPPQVATPLAAPSPRLHFKAPASQPDTPKAPLMKRVTSNGPTPAPKPVPTPPIGNSKPATQVQKPIPSPQPVAAPVVAPLPRSMPPPTPARPTVPSTPARTVPPSAPSPSLITVPAPVGRANPANPLPAVSTGLRTSLYSPQTPVPQARPAQTILMYSPDVKGAPPRPAQIPAPAPRQTPAPLVPRAPAPSTPMVRRPLPPAPLIRSFDFSFDAAIRQPTASSGKRMKTVKLNNMRGVTCHSTSIKHESTRLEVVAHLRTTDKLAETSGPIFTLRYEGRKIAGSLVKSDAMEENSESSVIGCRWDVPVITKSAYSTLEIILEQAGEKPHTESSLIFVGRQP